MCGIAGFTHRNTIPPEGIIARAMRSLHHRGPDQCGIFTGGAASLAAVRLKILDLAGGDQPMRSPDGGTVIVFNGEIYNFRAVRSELETLGHRFESNCDTEVVLHAWMEWRHDCFRRLHGMFAVALWEVNEERLVVARDRMGIKPLYIAEPNGELHFGSELKALFAHPGVARTLDTVALSYYLSLNHIPHPWTMASAVRKLAPGTWMEWQAGRTRTGRYWSVDFAPGEGITVEDATAELDRLLEQSVREHLVSDVPLGVWLSGGLDSSTITHYAAQHGPIETFSVSFQGRAFDESPYFRQVARHYGTRHHELDLSPDLDLAAAVTRLSEFSDEPSADAGALPVWFLSEMTRRHVTVALSGEGADELFGGYNTYLADRYARWARLLTPRLLRRAALGVARLLPVSDDKISFEYKLKRFLEGSLLDPTAAHLFWGGVYSESQKRAVLTTADPPSPAALFPALPDCGDLNRFLWLDQRLYLTEDILTKCDRMSMAHSLEVRPPFLDHRIVEFAARLPERWKIHGSTLKYVLRKLMRDRLPRPILARPKEGFDIPAHGWFRGALKPLLLETVTEAAARNIGVFRWPAIDDLMRAHFDRRINAGYHLWGLLNLFLWARRWHVQSSE